MSATAYPAFPDRPPRRWRGRHAQGGQGRNWLLGWRLPAMILGFIIWWPVGLALLSYFAWSRGMPCSSAAWMTPWKNRMRDAASAAFGPAPFGYPSWGNAAFDEHREAVLRRLDEERRALDAQQAEFAEFMAQLRRAKDKEEFDRFMASRGGEKA